VAFGASRALNALTLQASTGKLFQILSMRAQQNVFVNHNGKNDYAVYIASGVSSFIERKIGLYCCILHIVSPFNKKTVLSQGTIARCGALVPKACMRQAAVGRLVRCP